MKKFILTIKELNKTINITENDIIHDMTVSSSDKEKANNLHINESCKIKFGGKNQKTALLTREK